MLIFPATDIYDGAAVRLTHGDYDKMTVYEKDPVDAVRKFSACGAKCLHIVDLEGARDGGTPNLETIKKIAAHSEMFTQIGGGVRSADVIEKYLSCGIDRVILGTAAVTNGGFVREAIRLFGADKIACGVDIKDGRVAIRGWTQTAEIDYRDFISRLADDGVKTVICTDISRDGAMRGTNLRLYAELSRDFGLDIIASGGVSTLDDVRNLAKMNICGAIVGKAIYTGALDLAEAIKVADECGNGGACSK